ncbi:FliG C-terminal domain-containing protein [Magnetovibrio sp. PR-2]|uniref:FliG C-terminal domain-containing protein n=1 Tax=Magnetovibrio sp. PR-2 TaxID=3120356 RepID=UPI002FCDF2A1
MPRQNDTDPSMEDILSSIRRILMKDELEQATPTARIKRFWSRLFPGCAFRKQALSELRGIRQSLDRAAGADDEIAAEWERLTVPDTPSPYPPTAIKQELQRFSDLIHQAHENDMLELIERLSRERTDDYAQQLWLLFDRIPGVAMKKALQACGKALPELLVEMAKLELVKVEIVAELNGQLDKLIQERYWLDNQPQFLSRVLHFIPAWEERRACLEKLRHRQTGLPNITRAIESLGFNFADLQWLPKHLAAPILSGLSDDTWSLALEGGVNENILTSVWLVLPQERRENIEQKIEQMGAVREEDAHAARIRVVEHVRQWIINGDLVWPGRLYTSSWAFDAQTVATVYGFGSGRLFRHIALGGVFSNDKTLSQENAQDVMGLTIEHNLDIATFAAKTSEDNYADWKVKHCQAWGVSMMFDTDKAVIDACLENEMLALQVLPSDGRDIPSVKSFPKEAVAPLTQRVLNQDEIDSLLGFDETLGDGLAVGFAWSNSLPSDIRPFREMANAFGAAIVATCDRDLTTGSVASALGLDDRAVRVACAISPHDLPAFAADVFRSWCCCVAVVESLDTLVTCHQTGTPAVPVVMERIVS